MSAGGASWLLHRLESRGAEVGGVGGWCPRYTEMHLRPRCTSKITPHHPLQGNLSSLVKKGAGLPAGCLFPKTLSHFVIGAQDRSASLARVPPHGRPPIHKAPPSLLSVSPPPLQLTPPNPTPRSQDPKGCRVPRVEASGLAVL